MTVLYKEKDALLAGNDFDLYKLVKIAFDQALQNKDVNVRIKLNYQNNNLTNIHNWIYQLYEVNKAKMYYPSDNSADRHLSLYNKNGCIEITFKIN